MKYFPEAQSCNIYSIKAVLLQGDERLLSLHMNKKTYGPEDHQSKAKKKGDDLEELKIFGLFTCDLRKGIAPFIQLEKKRGKLAVLATHLLFFGSNSQQCEVDIAELPYGHRLANEWKLH